MSIGFLTIAGAFFLVTMALSVGPLLFCRLFLGTPHDERPRPGMFPFLPGLIALSALVFGVGAIIFSHRSQSSVGATVVDSSAPNSQRSLFEADAADDVGVEAPSVNDGRPVWWAVLLPILLVTTLLAFVGDRVRAGLFRMLPVAVVGCLVIVMFFRTSAEHRRPAEIDEQHAAQLERWEPERADQRAGMLPFRAPETASDGEPTEGEPADAAVSQTETPTDESPAVVEYVSTSAVGVPRAELPDWTTAKDNGPVRVIKSGLHATVELAEQNALDQLKSLVLADFVRQHPEARGWQPPDDILLQSHSILQRAMERSKITVGEFTNPMYEAYWQVDTTADASLYQAWRPTQVKTRLAWLGGGIGLLTLLFGSLAALLRVDEQTDGRKRKQLALGTVLLWAILGGALLFVA